VRGRIARVFRGDPALIGTTAVFGVDCCRPGDDIPVGGAIWLHLEGLEAAKVLEAYLDRDGDRYRVVSWQSTPLPALTDAPQLVFTEADARPPPPPPREWASMILGYGLFALFVGVGITGLVYSLWLLVR
jgi:hypothetical protein